MSFNNINFIFVFLPLFVIMHAITREKFRNILLLAGNFIFYFFAVGSSYEWIVILLLSAVVSYFIGLALERWKDSARKAVFICGIVYHVLILVAFKYIGYVFSSIVPAVIPSAKNVSVFSEILLPLGISFYTFKSIGYLYDVYRKKITAEKSFFDFAAYLTLFTQVTMGPIQSYDSIMKTLKRRKITAAGIVDGVTSFIFGLALKTIFSDRLLAIGNAMKTIGYDSVSTPLAWMGLIAFAMQLYFDFYGYSLMAEGIGSMLGLETPQNFDYPYTAPSMTQFWRRWHMTLGFWFREHLYIPLGGNRKGKWRTYLNLLIVWLVTGIWHGSTVMYLLWGLFLFAIIALEKSGWINKVTDHKVFSHFYMVPLILFSWMFFFLPSVADLGVYFTRLFPFIVPTPESVYALDFLPYLKAIGPTMFVGLLFCTPYPRKWYKKIEKIPWISIPLLFILFWVAVYLISGSTGNPFMYVNY